MCQLAVMSGSSPLPKSRLCTSGTTQLQVDAARGRRRYRLGQAVAARREREMRPRGENS